MAMRNKLELLTLSSNIKEWFERYEFFVLAEGLEVVPHAEASEEVKAAAIKKNLSVFINKYDAEI